MRATFLPRVQDFSVLLGLVVLCTGCFPQQKPETLPRFTTPAAAAGAGADPLFLDLTGQSLKALPDGVDALPGLVKLSLRGGAYGELPTGAWASRLHWLDVSAAGLTNVPPDISAFGSLETLYLSDNRLTSLPPEIGQLSKLAYLNLDRNRLASLPPGIGELKSLRWLRLNGNALATLPDELCQLESLERLYLAGNALQALPADIGNLSKLETLVLRKNDLPEEERQRIRAALPDCSVEF